MTAHTHFATSTSGRPLQRRLILAGIAFALGVTVGIFIRRSEVAISTPPIGGNAQLLTDSTANVGKVTPDRLKHMADKQAEPLLAQLQSTPNDAALLARLGNIYYLARNYREASTYFRRSLDVRDDVIVRIELGRAYYYSGNPDNALVEFENVLKSDPDNTNAMFNVGIVKWQSKSDVDGALAAWHQILKKNPNHPRRAEVEQLIARAGQHRPVK